MNNIRNRKCEICGKKTPVNYKPNFMKNFPIDEERCKQWVKYVGNEDLVYIPIEKIQVLKQVCSDHFLPEDFHKNNNQLKLSAVPSVGLTREPLSDDVFQDFPYHLVNPDTNQMDGSSLLCDWQISFATEHSYSSPGEQETENKDVDMKNVTNSIMINNEDNITSDGPEKSNEKPKTTNDLSDKPDASTDTKSEDLPRYLTNYWSTTLCQGLPQDIKTKVLKKYYIPKNCELLNAPTLNQRLTTVLPYSVKIRDRQLKANQNQLGLGIATIGKVLALLFVKNKTEIKAEVTDILLDACNILTDLHYTMSQTRLNILTDNEISFSID